MIDTACCDEWRELCSPEYSGGTPQGAEQLEDGAWAVNGCCGGGCFVVTGIRYCPFCGCRVQPADD